MEKEKILKINNLFVEYKTTKGALGGEKTIHAVNGVNLDINKGEQLTQKILQLLMLIQ